MRPAVVAFALALLLFLLVQGIQPPVLYGVLLIPALILVYGFVVEELPAVPYENEEETEGEEDRGEAGPESR